jgi:hypothetical protein
MSVGIITSAAYVNPEMSAEFGLLPPAFLPAGNTRLFKHQAALLANLVDRIVLTLPQSFTISVYDERLLASLGVTVIRLPDGLSLAQSIMLAIIQSIEGDEPAVILHGDTLFLKLEEFPLNRVSVHSKDHPYPWALVESDTPLTIVPSAGGAGSGLVSGLFSFSHSLSFLKCLAAPGSDFLSALNAYTQLHSDFRAMPDCGEWLDFGHLNTYYDSRKVLTTQRSFNALIIERDVVSKTSKQNGKMDAEASWFEALPVSVRPYIPTFLGRIGSGAQTSGYRLAYEYLCPLSDLYVFGALPPVTWGRILNACADVLTLFGSEKPPAADANDINQLYAQKTIERFSRFAAHAGIDLAREWRVNGETMPSPEHVIFEMAQIIGPPNEKEIALMHGDFCLSNILFDFRRNSIKLLDPRGYIEPDKPSIYGDIRYDAAKLHHSIVGRYDFIVAGYFDLARHGAYDISLEIAQAPCQAKTARLLREIIFEGDEHRWRVAGAISVLLFLSMLALHGDSEERQWALLANAYRLYQRDFH